ncbi:MAG: response regulator [Leptospiraceae bacterium]|nr:response regulator [Leptospiraceae bacterium]MCP5493825.1 response regulator [Leptospiraceae bacterium]
METPNILAIDDDPITLATIESMLKSFQYRYKLVDTSEKCFQLLDSQTFHIIIADLALPSLDNGLALIEKVHKEFPSIVIIVHSGHSEHDLIIKTLSKKKAYDYLVKPANTEALKYSIDRAFEYYTLNRKLESIKQQEESFFLDMIQIFDWKKELGNKYIDSLATSLIRQVNISMLQGGGFGAIISILSIFLEKAEYQPENKGYLVSEKIFKMIKDNYGIVEVLLRSLSDAQSLMMETEAYVNEIYVHEIIPFVHQCIFDLKGMESIKNQKIIISSLPYSIENQKIIFQKKKMELVIQELLINAMKYSQKEDEIYVLFFYTSTHFEIKILNKAYKTIDGSYGITGKNETRVFEPFFRLHYTVDESYDLEKFKFGLGLTVVKKILQLHGADISIYTITDNIKGNQNDVCAWIRFPFIHHQAV